MTFEDEKLLIAVETLKKTERECAGDIGWLKSITSKVFRSEEPPTSGVSRRIVIKLLENSLIKHIWRLFQNEYARRLERQIIVADTKVCSAMLTLVQQQVSGYVRGGWMMRKAWRVYQHTYLQILHLYRRTFGTNPSGTFYTHRISRVTGE